MSNTTPGWIGCRLGDISAYITSGSRDWSQFYADHGALFVRTQDINQNKLTEISEIARVSLPQKMEGKRTLIRKHDILITITGANVGKCAYINESISEAYVSQSVALVRLIDGSLGPFIQKQLVSRDITGGETNLEKAAYGLGRPVLSLGNVHDVPINLAPIAEQRRIVSKIDSLSAKSKRARQHLDHVPKLVGKYKQALLDLAFIGALTTEWRQVNGVSHDWNVRTIGSVAHIASGQTPKGIEDTLEPDGDVPWFKVSSMNQAENLSGLTNSDFRLSRASARLLGLRIVPAGSIAFPKRGGAIATNKKRRLLVDGGLDLNLMVLTATGVTPDFLWWWLQKLDLSSISNGSNVPQINNGDIEPLEIGAPSEPEQREIVRIVETSFAWIDRLASEATSARKLIDHLDQAILSKAFRGELVPQDPDDEPASVLLERIEAERAGATPARRGRGRPRIAQTM